MAAHSVGPASGCAEDSVCGWQLNEMCDSGLPVMLSNCVQEATIGPLVRLPAAYPCLTIPISPDSAHAPIS
jgi:hypothetical protein